MELNGKHILILGAGVNGIATAEYCAQEYPDATIAIADQKKIKVRIPGVTKLIGRKYPESLKEWDVVIVSPGIPPSTPLLKSAKEIINSAQLFFANCTGTVIGVTGSKGKSTVAALIAAILKEDGKQSHLVGNIGIPALSVLKTHNTIEDIFVMEISSYQARLLEAGPGIAVLTELFPEHIDYHGSVEQYYNDKLRVTTTQRSDQTVIYNAKNAELKKRMAKKNVQAQAIAIPSANTAREQDGTIYYENEALMEVDQIRLQGMHNIRNILLAITAAKQLRVENESIVSAVSAFRPLPHRLELVGTYKGVTFINDSLSTTPESTVAAIESLEAVHTIFLGGTDRGYDFTPLITALKERDADIRNFVFFPNSGSTIKDLYGEFDREMNILETESMDEAIAFAYKHTPSGGTALLSCAAPSYAMFKNYADRGDQFVNAIQEQGTD